MMTKGEALCVLIEEARAERTTRVGIKRIYRACIDLDCTLPDLMRVMRRLDIVDQHGRVYIGGFKPPWEKKT